MKVIKLWALQTYIKSIEVDGKIQTSVWATDARKFYSHETKELDAYMRWLDSMRFKYVVEELTFQTKPVQMLDPMCSSDG